MLTECLPKLQTLALVFELLTTQQVHSLYSFSVGDDRHQLGECRNGVSQLHRKRVPRKTRTCHSILERSFAKFSGLEIISCYMMLMCVSAMGCVYFTRFELEWKPWTHIWITLFRLSGCTNGHADIMPELDWDFQITSEESLRHLHDSHHIRKWINASFYRRDNGVLDANRNVDRVGRRIGNRTRELEIGDLHSSFHLSKSQGKRCTIEVAEIWPAMVPCHRLWHG